MKLRLTLAAALALAVAIAATTALAAPPTPDNPAGRALGIVPPHGNAGGKPGGPGGLLTYHGGPVMRTNATYAIYWLPAPYTMGTGYQSTIDQYLSDVASDSGLGNVYGVLTQYYDTTGPIAQSSSFGGSFVDTTPFPASGCRDRYTTVCLSDAQVQAEIEHVKSVKGWQSNATTLFFVFTPKDVGSCFGSSCAFSTYCAYHDHYGSGSTVTLYANVPYAESVPSACGSGESPNGNDADSTLNVASHEHREAINDEQGTAWYDQRGYEGSDKCAWNFGTALGGASGAQYNQVINRHHYYVQQEWSNAIAGCALTG
jgi:hypothetical protein